MDPDLMAEYAKEDPNGLKNYPVKKLNSLGLILTMRFPDKTERYTIPCVHRIHYLPGNIYLYCEDVDFDYVEATVEFRCSDKNMPGYLEFERSLPRPLHIEQGQTKKITCRLMNEKGEMVPCTLAFKATTVREALRIAPKEANLPF